MQNILVLVDDHIATITINREAKLNALNTETLQEIALALNELENNEIVKGVIITGSGEKAFVAGADIKEFVGLSESSAKELSEYGHVHVMNRIEGFSKPVIAAVNGFALGGGLELAMACHIRIAVDTAKFGQPEVSLGIIPGYGGTQRLPQLVGKGKAMEMILTGDMIDCQEALRWGLVNHMVSQDELISRSKEILQTIFTRSPQAITKAIQAVNAGVVDTVRGSMLEIDLFAQAFSTDESKEGISAFIERRKPNF